MSENLGWFLSILASLCLALLGIVGGHEMKQNGKVIAQLCKEHATDCPKVCIKLRGSAESACFEELAK